MAGRLPFVLLRVGGWWRANEEIRVVVPGQEAALLLECKWAGRRDGLLLSELARIVAGE